VAQFVEVFDCEGADLLIVDDHVVTAARHGAHHVNVRHPRRAQK
jgi:hypothetical protein